MGVCMMVARYSAVVYWVSQSIVRIFKSHTALVIFQPVWLRDKPWDRGELHGTSHSPDLHTESLHIQTNHWKREQTFKSQVRKFGFEVELKNVNHTCG